MHSTDWDMADPQFHVIPEKLIRSAPHESSSTSTHFHQQSPIPTILTNSFCSIMVNATNRQLMTEAELQRSRERWRDKWT